MQTESDNLELDVFITSLQMTQRDKKRTDERRTGRKYRHHWTLGGIGHRSGTCSSTWKNAR
jgi:hypothetical protein